MDESLGNVIFFRQVVVVVATIKPSINKLIFLFSLQIHISISLLLLLRTRYLTLKLFGLNIRLSLS